MPFPSLFEDHLEKKTLCPAEQHRNNVAEQRNEWQQSQEVLDVKKLVFLDETWAKTNITPLYDWVERGKRLISFVPHGHWKTTTFIAALRHKDMPQHFPSGSPCWRRLKWWYEQGALLEAWQTILGMLDKKGRVKWEECFADGTFASAKKGAKRSATRNEVRERK